MIKKIIETPKYETVQVGVEEKEVWITSDGKEFDKEQNAGYHEFYNCKLKQRNLYHLPVQDVRIFNFETVEDLNKYEEEYIYDQIIEYDKSKFIFPSTFVMWEEWVNSDHEEYYYGKTSLFCVTLDEYKRLMIEGIKNL